MMIEIEDSFLKQYLEEPYELHNDSHFFTRNKGNWKG